VTSRCRPEEWSGRNAFVFPAGDPDVRFNIAIHRLTNAEPAATVVRRR